MTSEDRARRDNVDGQHSVVFGSLEVATLDSLTGEMDFISQTSFDELSKKMEELSNSVEELRRERRNLRELNHRLSNIDQLNHRLSNIDPGDYQKDDPSSWDRALSLPSGRGDWANIDSETCRRYFGWLEYSGGTKNLDVTIPLVIGLMMGDSRLRLEPLSGPASQDSSRASGKSFTTSDLYHAIHSIEYFLDSDKPRTHPAKVVLDSVAESRELWLRLRYDIVDGIGEGIRFTEKESQESSTEESTHRRKIRRKLKSGFVKRGLLRRDSHDSQTWHAHDPSFIGFCKQMVDFSAKMGGLSEEPQSEPMESDAISKEYTLRRRDSRGRIGKPLPYRISISPIKREEWRDTEYWAVAGKWINACETAFNTRFSNWLEGGEWFMTSIKEPEARSDPSKPTIGWVLHNHILSAMEQEKLLSKNKDVPRSRISEILLEKGVSSSQGRISQVLSDLSSSGDHLGLGILEHRADPEDGRARLYRFASKGGKSHFIQDSIPHFHLEKVIDWLEGGGGSY